MNKLAYTIGYAVAKIKSVLCSGNLEILNAFYRKGGVKLGSNCLICSPLPYGRDACLLEIKDNTVVSVKVDFILHDFSISKVIPGTSNLFGKIVVGNNCFVGARSVIMYGVELADNIIVAAGSVVTKSFSESNIIIGGNPARKIGTWDALREKSKPYANNYTNVKDLVENHPELLVKK